MKTDKLGAIVTFTSSAVFVCLLLGPHSSPASDKNEAQPTSASSHRLNTAEQTSQQTRQQTVQQTRQQTVQQTVQRPRELRHRTLSDQNQKFSIREIYNEHGTFEVQVHFIEERPLAPDTEHLILIGRAIDPPTLSTALPPTLPTLLRHTDSSFGEGSHDSSSSRRITTWFIPTSLEILRPIRFEQTSEDPWPAALSVIRQHIPTKSRFYGWLAAETLARHMSLAISHHRDFFEDLKKEQLQLLELEVRVRNLELRSPEDPFIPFGKSFIAEGWESIHQRIKNEQTRTVWLYAAGDVALAAIGAKLVQIIKKGFASGKKSVIEGSAEVMTNSSQSAAVSKVKKFISDTHSKLLGAFGEKAALASSPARNTSAGLVASAAMRISLSKLTIQSKISTSIAYLQARSMISRAALSALQHSVAIAKGGLREWKYVALSPTVQIVAEAAARPDDLFDPNPIVMAKKMASDEEFVQNVAYMTNETFWMAGIASRFGAGKVKTFAIAGAVAMVNSLSMSLLVKGEADPIRVGFDTGWEVIIGNLQTTVIDANALRYFEGLAAKQSDPKLAVIGYVIALVNQGAGYYGYAKASHFIETQHSSAPEKPEPIEPSSTTPELKLIPVLGPV